jgi:hypothetical protein
VSTKAGLEGCGTSHPQEGSIPGPSNTVTKYYKITTPLLRTHGAGFKFQPRH